MVPIYEGNCNQSSIVTVVWHKKQHELFSISIWNAAHAEKQIWCSCEKQPKQSSSAWLEKFVVFPFWIFYLKQALSVQIPLWSRLVKATLTFWAGQLTHGPGLRWRRSEILSAGESGSAQSCWRKYLVLFRVEALQTKLMHCQLWLSPGLGNCFLCFELFSQVLSSTCIAPISSGIKHQAGKYAVLWGASSLDRISHQWAQNGIAH